jgi:hypothetical protein
MSRSCLIALCLTLSVAAGATAHAEVRAGLRIGVEPLALEPSSDTPMLGAYIDDAVDAYNLAAASYNRSHDYAMGSAKAVAAIERSDLGLHTTMAMFAPGVELGTRRAALRVEGLIGVSDEYRAYGFALYPVDLALPMRRGAITPYLQVGGTFCWLERSNVGSEVGALISVRAAAGVRIRRVTVEVGYRVVTVGGVVDSTKLRTMAQYDPTGSAPPPQADRAVVGGKQSGMLDVSLGISL